MAPQAFKLLQGYIWYPRTTDFSLNLPEHLALEDGTPAHIVTDPVEPPFAFFENGTPTASQHFWQITVIVRTELGSHQLKAPALEASTKLSEWLDSTPPDVGWQIMEDLRPVYF